MVMDATPSALLYLISALTSAVLAVYSWRRRRYRTSLPFSALMGALSFWSFCHALSVADPTLEGTLFWAQVQYGGIVLVGPLWLLFALAYANQDWRLTRFWRMALFLPALVAYVLVLSNNLHHLWWTRVEIDTSRAFVSLSVDRGWLFWLHIAYSYSCVIIGVGLFFRTMIVTPPLYQRQARLMLMGALIPVLGNAAHLMGLQTSAVDDPTPFLFVASGLVACYALLRYQFLDLVPIAEREIFASMPDGVVVLDQHGIVTAINERAPDLLAVNTTRLIGRPLRDVVASSPLATDLLATLSDTAPLPTRRITYMAAEGLCGVEIRLRPLATGNSIAAGSLLLLRDITERIRMEQALDQRVAELTLINQMARAVNVVLETDDLVRVITRELVQAMAWDRVAVGLLQPDGTTLRLIIDQSLDATPLFEGRYVAIANFAPLHALLSTNRTGVIDGTDPCLAGTLTGRVLRRLGLRTVVVVPLCSQAQLLGVLFVGDTTARPAAPESLHLAETVGELVTEAIVRTRLYEEAQQASRLKSAFLAMVSHELRTPLTSIIGYADMLRRGMYGTLPEHVHEPLDFIRQGSHALLRLINDILDLSKMEAGRFTVDLHPVELGAVINNVAGVLRPQIVERGLALHIDVASRLPLVYASSTRLEQVLTNLIANAIKFTDTGSITIRARQHGDHLRLSVQDTGIGIAPEDQDTIFGEFRQIDSPHTRRFGGTGLGLAICRRLVNLMGGTISLESSVGVGSTFHVDLRLANVGAFERVAGGE